MVAPLVPGPSVLFTVGRALTVGRLADVEMIRRAGERLFADHREQVLHLTQGHVITLCYGSNRILLLDF